MISCKSAVYLQAKAIPLSYLISLPTSPHLVTHSHTGEDIWSKGSNSGAAGITVLVQLIPPHLGCEQISDSSLQPGQCRMVTGRWPVPDKWMTQLDLGVTERTRGHTSSILLLNHTTTYSFSLECIKRIIPGPHLLHSLTQIRKILNSQILQHHSGKGQI